MATIITTITATMITMTTIDSNYELYSGIDIGSNTIRLIIGYFKDGKLHTLKKYLDITRLGRDFHETRRLSARSIGKSLDTLSDYSNIIREHNIDKVNVCATGVLRKAQNAKEFTAKVQERTGLTINIISGDEEARLTALGVKSVVKVLDSIIFDVGGGSTEFIRSKENAPSAVRSVDIGAVTLYESFLKNDPPHDDELEAMNRSIKQGISDVMSDMSLEGSERAGALIFTAGTATTLAAIKLNMADYDPEKINNVTMTYDEVSSLYDELIKKNHSEREKIIGLEKGRADIIISGTAIALNVMELFGIDDMTISDAGLLEGIVIDGSQLRRI